MAFIPYSNESKPHIYITVEKQGRIYLSSGLQGKLGCENEEIELFLFFEPETRRIGISKEYPGKYKPFVFDKDRAYSDARRFLHDNDIEYREGAVRYYYDGTYGGVMTFKASQEYIEPIRTSFRPEKNGNLERLNDEAI